MSQARLVPVLLALTLAVPAAAQAPSRYAEACEKAARTALVPTFTFAVTSIRDETPAANMVVVSYTATSKSSGKVYPTDFTCVFADTANPQNIVLDQAIEGVRPFGPSSVNALNRMLQAEGFQAGAGQ